MPSRLDGAKRVHSCILAGVIHGENIFRAEIDKRPDDQHVKTHNCRHADIPITDEHQS
jgi:hypothetical protein